MKVVRSLLVAAALLFSPALHAQNPPGYGSTNGTHHATSWPLLITGLIIVVILGIVVSVSAQGGGSFSHNQGK